MVSINLKAAEGFISESLLNEQIEKAYAGLDTVLAGNGAGNDFLGWVNLPSEIDGTLIDACNSIVKRWIGKVDAVVVVGIGGSYLGAKCAIEALSHTFAASMPNTHPRKKKADVARSISYEVK